MDKSLTKSLPMSKADLRRARRDASRVATVRAMALLNTFQDALETGVLCIGPDISQDQSWEIERELGIFASQLPQLHRDLGTPPDLFATYHLRRWDDAAETQEGATADFTFTDLLKESAKRKKGADALDVALRFVEELDCPRASGFMIRFYLRTARSCLVEIKPDDTRKEPGVVGERLRACDEAFEYVLSNMHMLRKDDSQEWADVLVDNCGELGVRAKALADHIRTEGWV